MYVQDTKIIVCRLQGTISFLQAISIVYLACNSIEDRKSQSNKAIIVDDTDETRLLPAPVCINTCMLRMNTL